MHAGQAAALGLGEMSLNSFLNEPLDAEVTLLDTRDLTTDDIRIRLAGVADFDRLGVDRDYFLTSIEFTVSVDPATGRGVIRLSTEELVVEPFLDLIIEARWPSGRLLREYTVLVDPPAFRQEMLTVSASERVAETEGEEAAAEPAPETGELTAVTGDRVQVLDSDPAPGEMPRRPFSEATAASPEAGSRYLVKRDETLWQIASRARPEGVSVQQAMLDIQRLNPEAFIDGNINQIKAGYIIYLPSAADISSDDLADALAEVQAQNRAWQSGRGRTPGVTAAATLRISADDGRAGAPAPADTDSAAAAGPSRDGGVAAAADSGPAAEAAAPGAPSAERAAEPASPAEPVTTPAAADGAMAGELAAQLSAMAERLDALEATVSVKDQEIARLEAALREARESAEAAVADAAAARALAAAPAQPGSPAPSAAGGFMPWVYGIAGAVVLALLAVLGLRRARGGATPARAELAPGRAAAPASPAAPAAADDDVFAGVTLREEAVEEAVEEAAAGRAPVEAEEPARRDVAERGYGERRYDDYIDDADGGDALAEADIYIAYGRYLQAAELLTSAIRSEPGNSAFRLKLLELYADMGEGDKAHEQLEALREQGDAEAIARGERIVGGAAPAAPAAKAAPEREPEPEPEPEPLMQAAAEPEAGELAASEEDEEAALGAFDGLHIEEEPPGAVAGEALDLELEEPLRDPVEAAEAVDFGAPALEVNAQGSSADAGSEGDEELVFAEEGDQMATRLDLARAYLDMGDQDGARSILEEVARSGNAEQQQEANTLLARLG